MNARRRTRNAALAIIAPALGIALIALGAQVGPDGDATASLDPAGHLVTSTENLPRRLSDTGLYQANGEVDPLNVPFAPQYPLWTDGASKRRWVRLPKGATIDATDIDAWRFPKGTTFWKEFAWEGRKVETRMIRRGDDGAWSFATYVWNDEQTDATLAPEAGIPDAFTLPASVSGTKVRKHSIPGTADCLSCHASNPSVAIGFDALQLSDDRDPGAPHAESLPPGAVTLKRLITEGRLLPARKELLASPPRIRADDPIARSARGYLSANCGSCHNAKGPLARLGFSFKEGVGKGAAPSPIAAHSRYLVPGVAAESSFVLVAGAPEHSAALYRMKSRRPASQMPPLGTSVADTAGVALVTRWVRGMDASTDRMAVGTKP